MFSPTNSSLHKTHWVVYHLCHQCKKVYVSYSVCCTMPFTQTPPGFSPCSVSICRSFVSSSMMRNVGCLALAKGTEWPEMFYPFWSKSRESEATTRSFRFFSEKMSQSVTCDLWLFLVSSIFELSDFVPFSSSSKFSFNPLIRRWLKEKITLQLQRWKAEVFWPCTRETWTHNCSCLSQTQQTSSVLYKLAAAVLRSLEQRESTDKHWQMDSAAHSQKSH